MKTKAPAKPTEMTATVTSTAKLTIQGQTFEMPLSELEDLYTKIGKALGKRTDASDMEKIRKMFEEQNKGRDRMRPSPSTPWPTVPFLLPQNIPNRPSWENPVICKDAGPTFSMNACAIQR